MDRPAHLFDPDTGVVELVLYPFHLDRLHGRYLGPREDAATCAGLPFPMLQNSEPIRLCLTPGLTPEEIAAVSPFERNSSLGNRSWWRWHAYAWTPFGWSTFPTPHFYSDRLGTITFGVHGSGSVEVRLNEVKSYVEAELGEPDEILCRGIARNPTAKPGDRPDIIRWVRIWGVVTVCLEARDHEPQMSIAWTRAA